MTSHKEPAEVVETHIIEHIRNVSAYVGHPPRRVILFAEDYDMLARGRIRTSRWGVPIVRGPSREAYR